MGTWLLMDQVNREFNYFPFLRDKKNENKHKQQMDTNSIIGAEYCFKSND